MDYTAKFEPDEGGFLVTFPAIPEAITGGKDESEAIDNAMDALEVCILTYAQDGTPLPADITPAQAGDYRRIGVSAAVVAKVALITAFGASGLSKRAFGHLIGKNDTEVQRLLDPHHATKLRAIEAGLAGLGKRLIVTVEKAA